MLIYWRVIWDDSGWADLFDPQMVTTKKGFYQETLWIHWIFDDIYKCVMDVS